MATITGGTGDDTLSGGGDDDVISGQSGNDDLHGGAGDDILVGGLGNDTLDGGDGDDTLCGEDGNDSLDGGMGDDSLSGGSGDDTLVGGEGNDVLSGGGGNDALYGQEGADVVYGYAGNDTIAGGSGNDFIDGGSDSDVISIGDGGGNDTVYGGGGGVDSDTLDLSQITGPVTVTYTGDEAGTITDGTDTITFFEIEQLILTDQADAVHGDADSTEINVDGRGGDDSLDGGSGNDTLLGGLGNDSLDGNDGDDLLSGGDGSDSIYGDNGADTILGGAGNDELDGEAGSDFLDGGAGADTLDGGAGNDTLLGQDGDDELYAGAGDDTIDGGAGDDFILGQSGDDSISGGAGNDTITTGTGDDLVVFEQYGANDTVTDFDISDTDDDGNSNDQLDVSDLRDLDGNPVNIWDVVVTDDGSGNAVLTFPKGETLTLQGITPAQMTGQQMMASGIPCYAPGTLIDTPDGPRAVEDLQIGDLVNTLDHGPQQIRWVRNGEHSLKEVNIDGQPVLIAAGALGKGLPTQDLIVSPQHRMLVGGDGQLDGWFKTEAFAPAKSLTAVQGIRHMKGEQTITWFHFACDRHEVVTANGCLSESLLLGPMVIKALARPERQELTAIYGAAASPDAALNGPAARECLKVGEVRRHIATCKKKKEQRIVKEIKKWDVDLTMEQYNADQLGLKPTKSQKPKLRRVV
ncbi:Hint domain-containing protein [Thioclava sp.]|uniref:Hint domain-containing protein n=1 Tax=Thioclava sp. TaxID=1933450 RepID=UPI003AA83B73